MKNYASKKTHQGRTTFRTPSGFLAKKLFTFKKSLAKPQTPPEQKTPSRFPTRNEGRGKNG